MNRLRWFPYWLTVLVALPACNSLGPDLPSASAELDDVVAEGAVALHPSGARLAATFRFDRCGFASSSAEPPRVGRKYEFEGDAEWMAFFEAEVPRRGWSETADFMTGGGETRVLNFERQFDKFKARLRVTSDARYVTVEVVEPNYCA